MCKKRQKTFAITSEELFRAGSGPDFDIVSFAKESSMRDFKAASMYLLDRGSEEGFVSRAPASASFNAGGKIDSLTFHVPTLALNAGAYFMLMAKLVRSRSNQTLRLIVRECQYRFRESASSFKLKLLMSFSFSTTSVRYCKLSWTLPGNDRTISPEVSQF